MAEDKQPTPISGMHGVHLAVLFLVTAPVMGWMAGMALQSIGIGMGGGYLSGDKLFVLGFVIGLSFGIFPLAWIAGLVAAWRDLGRDKFRFVRYSPRAIVGVLILAAYATVSNFYR